MCKATVITSIAHTRSLQIRVAPLCKLEEENGRLEDWELAGVYLLLSPLSRKGGWSLYSLTMNT